MRGIADTTQGAGLLRAHAVRTTVNQAALFGSPFVGLLLFRFGGVDAVLIGICVLQAVALLLLVPVPRIGGGYERGARHRRAGTRLRLGSDEPAAAPIGLANLIWNVFAGSALGILPAVLREHLGLDEVTASAAFIAGMVVVVVLTLPVTRGVQRRLGPFPAFLAAIGGPGRGAPAVRPVVAAVLAPAPRLCRSSSRTAPRRRRSTARARSRSHKDQQALLSIIVITLGMIGFVLGLVVRRGPARRHRLRPRPRSGRRRDGGHGGRVPSPGLAA